MLALKTLALLPFTFFIFQAGFTPAVQAPLQGIYLTSHSVVSDGGAETIKALKNRGGNLLVVDVQSSGGKLAYPSYIPLSIELDNRSDVIPNLRERVKELHSQGFYVVARYVLFKNGFLAYKKPEWTLKKKGTASPFFTGEGPIWLDPQHPELKKYLIDVGMELSLSGFDEVQFDYVRFPAGGKGGYIGYSFTDDDILTRDQAITDFVAEISDTLHMLGTKVSVDIFGIVVWDDVSWRIIGQSIKDLGYHVDAMYPMPYPSHFGYGWGGHTNPADEPYFFVQETTKKFLEQTRGTNTTIRPWLQGFSMHVSNYGSNYIKEQIRALADIGINEFAVWNARNDYSVTFPALDPERAKERAKDGAK